jgi:hypothetical protein
MPSEVQRQKNSAHISRCFHRTLHLAVAVSIVGRVPKSPSAYNCHLRPKASATCTGREALLRLTCDPENDNNDRTDGCSADERAPGTCDCNSYLQESGLRVAPRAHKANELSLLGRSVRIWHAACANKVGENDFREEEILNCMPDPEWIHQRHDCLGGEVCTAPSPVSTAFPPLCSARRQGENS